MKTQADSLRSEQVQINIESQGLDHTTSLHKYLVSERDKVVNKLNNITPIW